MTVTLANTFSDLTEIRDMFDDLNGKYSGLKTAKNAIVSRFDTSGFEDLIGQSENATIALFNALDTACAAYKQLFVSRLIHRLMLEDYSRIALTPGLTQDQLIERFLVAFYAELESQIKTVQSNVVTVGSVTESTTKSDAGSVSTTTRLLGCGPPTVGGYTNLYYFDNLTELAKTDTCFIECMEDTQSNLGISRGYEKFICSGLPAAPSPFSGRYTTDGDGTVAYMSPVQGRSVIDLGFDDFTSHLPDDWTHVSGTAGTHYGQESTAAKVIDGTGSALWVLGDGQIYRSISRTVVRGRSQMLLAFLVAKDGALAGTYTITVTGTGFSTVTSGPHNASSLGSTFTPVVVRVPIPANVPSDLRINISWSSVSGGNVLFDQGGFAEYQYWNGVGIGLYEGHDRFTVGDTYTFSISNDYAGDAQTLFAKALRAQMRSTTVGYDYA